MWIFGAEIWKVTAPNQNVAEIMQVQRSRIVLMVEVAELGQSVG
jgi:hypothetical protein